MKTTLKAVACVIALMLCASAFGAKPGKHFNRAIFVLFENVDYAEVLKQPFFKKLADSGALFSNFTALTHPSQGNYIALTSGSTDGITGDQNTDLDVTNVVDLLEAKGVSWKVYAEEYPGNCFAGSSKGDYSRNHNPFISYLNIRKMPLRCMKIVNAREFYSDAASGRLPEYVFYVPNNKNSGHDTGIIYADDWYGRTFGPYVADPKFMDKTVLISAFDEDESDTKTNQIYASIVGPAVRPGVYPQHLNLISLLRLIEDNWDLGDLGKDDMTSPSIPNIWK